MADYRVELDSYSGPLDLLMYLVRRHEIDLNNIPIAKLTEQYLEHLKLIQHIDVELVGEFLVMAATLLEIKSAMLLPRGQDVSGEPDTSDVLHASDPRTELVQQLLAYKRFKDAAGELEQRRQQWALHYPFQPLRPDHATLGESAQLLEFDLEDANVLDLCEAYGRVLESVGRNRSILHEVLYDDTPIALHAEDIVDRLNREGPMSLQEMFVGRTNRGEKIGLFLATLELVRQSKIRFVQDSIDHQIQLTLRQDETDNTTDPDSPTVETDDKRPYDLAQ